MGHGFAGVPAEIDVEHREGDLARLHQRHRGAYRTGDPAIREAQAAQDVFGFHRDDDVVFDDQRRSLLQRARKAVRYRHVDGGRVFRGAGRLEAGDMLRRQEEQRFQALLRVDDRGGAAEFVRDRALDDGGAEAAPGGRLHRRTIGLAPVDLKRAVVVAAERDRDRPARIRQSAVLAGIGHQLVEHQRQSGEGAGRDQRVGAVDRHAVGIAGGIGGGFRADEVVERGGRPVLQRHLVVGAGKGVDAAADDLGELVDRRGAFLALGHEAADQVEDIADAVVEFRDQHVLLPGGLLAFGMDRIGQPQHDFEKRDTQGIGSQRLFLGPGAGVSPALFLPDLEAFARRQPGAERAEFDGLFRVPRPVDLAQLLAAKQHDIVARGTAHGQGQEARRPIGPFAGRREDRSDRVRRPDGAGPRGVEESREFAELHLVRNRAVASELPVDPADHAVEGNDPGDRIGKVLECLQQGSAGSNAGHHLVMKPHRGGALGQREVGLLLLQQIGEEFPEQFAGGADRVGQPQRRMVVARHQPPELAAPDDRDRHRSLYAHVAQIFDMDRRNRAQSRHRQIERVAVGIGGGVDLHGGIVHVADDAQQVAGVEPPCLGRNVRGGEVQPLEAVHHAVEAFRHDFARTVAFETVDHDAVEAGEAAQVPGGAGAKLLDRGGLAHPVDHGPDIAHEIAASAAFVRLDLQHVGAAGNVHRHIEQAAVAAQVDLEHALHGAGAAQDLQAGAHVVQGIGRKELGGGKPHHVARRNLEQVLAVGRDVVDDPVAGERQEPAETLDPADDVNRFEIAGVQVHPVHAVSHARHPPECRRPKRRSPPVRRPVRRSGRRLRLRLPLRNSPGRLRAGS